VSDAELLARLGEMLDRCDPVPVIELAGPE